MIPPCGTPGSPGPRPSRRSPGRPLVTSSGKPAHTKPAHGGGSLIPSPRIQGSHSCSGCSSQCRKSLSCRGRPLRSHSHHPLRLADRASAAQGSGTSWDHGHRRASSGGSPPGDRGLLVLRRSVMRLNSSVAADRRRCRGMPGRRVKTEILCRTLRFLQGLKTVQEHHEGEAVRYEVPVPERAPHRALGAGGLYVDVRVLLPVPLKPRNLVRRARGNISHGSVSLPGKRSTQALPKSDATRRGNQAAVPGERPMPPALLTVPLREVFGTRRLVGSARRSRFCRGGPGGGNAGSYLLICCVSAVAGKHETGLGRVSAARTPFPRRALSDRT